jgi:hypothetical protein
MLFLLALAFDSEHCKRKCESLFSDSPTRRALCLGTCSNGFVERERVQFGEPQMKKEVSVCLAKCNQNVNSTTDFRSWTKCRRACVVDPETEQQEFFARSQCDSECDRYWKGTVHWRPCQDQCQAFAPQGRGGPTPPPGGAEVRKVW